MNNSNKELNLPLQKYSGTAEGKKKKKKCFQHNKTVLLCQTGTDFKCVIKQILPGGRGNFWNENCLYWQPLHRDI